MPVASTSIVPPSAQGVPPPGWPPRHFASLGCMVNKLLTQDESTGRRQMTDTTVVRHKRGGLYFEDFVVGEVHEHRYTRTVTQMDNMLFSNMTLNPQPLHIDRHFCEQETEWGQPLMNS